MLSLVLSSIPHRQRIFWISSFMHRCTFPESHSIIITALSFLITSPFLGANWLYHYSSLPPYLEAFITERRYKSRENIRFFSWLASRYSSSNELAKSGKSTFSEIVRISAYWPNVVDSGEVGKIHKSVNRFREEAILYSTVGFTQPQMLSPIKCPKKYIHYSFSPKHPGTRWYAHTPLAISNLLLHTEPDAW